jgi:hypothetical protein
MSFQCRNVFTKPWEAEVPKYKTAYANSLHPIKRLLQELQVARVTELFTGAVAKKLMVES